MNRKIILWAVICIAIIAIPFILNFTIGHPAIFQVVGGINADGIWLAFWAAYIGAIASFVMAYITYKALLQNKNQLRYQQRKEWLSQLAIIHKNMVNLCHGFGVRGVAEMVVNGDYDGAFSLGVTIAERNNMIVTDFHLTFTEEPDEQEKKYLKEIIRLNNLYSQNLSDMMSLAKLIKNSSKYNSEQFITQSVAGFFNQEGLLEILKKYNGEIEENRDEFINLFYNAWGEEEMRKMNDEWLAIYKYEKGKIDKEFLK